MPFAGKFTKTQDYGVKVKYMRCGYHTGIDWGLPTGTPLISCFSGKVIKAAKWNLTGYGREIQIQRADGLIAQYAHCSEILCEVGNDVEAGAMIGKSGHSGYCISSIVGGTGAHLHFGTMFAGKWFDPKSILDGQNLLSQLPAEPKKDTEIKVPVVNKDEVVAEIVHTVEKGDTLSKIAKTYLGNGNLWEKLFLANKDTMANPNKLKIGQKIKIPNEKK